MKVFLFLLYSVFYFSHPYSVPDDSHDLGSQACIDYWVEKKVQFGVDLIQNVGPLGGLSYPTLFSGYDAKEKMLLS